MLIINAGVKHGNFYPVAGNTLLMHILAPDMAHTPGVVVLSTDPVPVAFSEIRLIPFYNTVEDALADYKVYRDDADYIVYTSEFYPCFTESCSDQKMLLFSDIRKKQLLFNRTFDQEYYIFRT